MRTLFALLIGTAVVIGCGAQEEPATQATADAATPEASDVADEVIVTDSGLQYIDEVVGEGDPATVGDTVVVHYRGTLEDGTEFDASYNRNQPFPVTLGQGRVIAGWEEGLQGMRVGGKRRLIIPPELGYGSRAVGARIPANSTLIFDVELLEIR